MAAKRRVRRTIPLLLLWVGPGLLALGGVSCRPAEVEETAAPPLSEEEMDRLRALPYLEFAEEPAGPQDGVVVHDPDRAWPGYTLFTTRALCRADLVDMEGRRVHSWVDSGECSVWVRGELQPDGDLLVVGRSRGSRRWLQRISWQGETLWRRSMPVHHDVERLPDGRLAVLTMRSRAVSELHATLPVRDDGVALLSPDGGSLLEERSLWGLLGASEPGFSVRPITGEPPLDVFHANSVEWLDAASGRPGQVLVSMRHQDAVALFDWRRARLLWSWGPGELRGPHDATWLPGGTVLVFDNGVGRGWSRAVEVDPASDEIVWEYRAPPDERFFTRSLGAAQRLPNGNTLLAESERGRAFEVTPEGEIVWELLTPHRNERGRRAVFVRARRHGAEEIRPLLERLQ